MGGWRSDGKSPERDEARSDSTLDSVPAKNKLPPMDAERTGVSFLSGTIQPMLKTL
jgi:hypothetical protein